MNSILFSLLLLAASGCVAGAYRPPELPATHPASIAAEEAPLPPPSEVLTTREADEAQPKAGSEAAAGKARHAHGHAVMEHEPHHQEAPPR